MVGDFFEHLKHHIIPSERNSYRPHLLRRPWLALFLGIILAAEGFLVTNLIVRQSSQSFLAAVVPGEVIALTNVAREQNHVAGLQENTELDAAAQAKAQDMAAKGYFSHIGPDGKEPWAWIEEAGYDYQYAGENLAVRFVDSSDVVNAWMASPSHQANIVKGVYTNVGVGVAQGIYQGQSATFVVEYFATPAVSTLSLPSAVATSAGPLLQSVEQWSTRTLAHIEAEPLIMTERVLAIVAAVLLLAVLLAFLLHIQIQPIQMLLTGTALAGFAVFLIVCNNRFLTGAASTQSQSASVMVGFEGVEGGVVIDSEATSTER